MKNILFYVWILLGLTACNNQFLELTPTTQISEGDEFWRNESGLETFSNGFYGYIERNDILGDFTSDNAEHRTSPPAIRRKDYTLPTSLGSGGWNWTQLRNLNYFIEKTQGAGVDEGLKHQYTALAKFFRAWFYFKKIQHFGDVPWYGRTLQTDDDTELYKGRDARTLVIDSVVADLDDAIRYLPETKYKNRISKWAALALKSRVCLYEGTWRKYHSEAGLAGAEALLQQAADAAGQLIESGTYTLYSTGNPAKDYFDLFQPKDTYTAEVILARSSDTQTFYYTPNFTSTSNGNYGATRDLVSSYLMKDGRTFQERYPSQRQRDTMSYYDEFQDRDPRLAQSYVYPGYIRVGTTAKTVTDFNQNATGYMIHKAVGPPSEDQGGGYRDVIMMRYAEVLLNYAEAKAELGTLTQQDLDRTVNAIRTRVGVAPLLLSAPADPYQQSIYPGVSDAMVLEVRRERRVELAFEGFRTDDMKRWKAGNLFRTRYEGIYITGLRTYIDLDHDGSADLYVYPTAESAPSNQISGVQYFHLNNVHGLSEGTKGRIVPFNQTLPAFEDWEYLDPLPSEELTLNDQLVQNPGWAAYQ